MGKYIYLTFILFFIGKINSNVLLAQSTRSDSSSQQNAFNNAVTAFNASMGKQSQLYNGPEYYLYSPIIKGNAYFSEVNTFTSGSVYYNDVFYSGVPMLYDLNKDEVVVLLYNHFSRFSLIQDKVKWFDFLGHHFININADTININSGVKSGFYDEIYNGKTKVLVKRVKDIQTNNGGLNGLESYFNAYTEYYFLKAHVYYSVSGQGSFLEILKDKRKELQEYIKSNKIKFRKTPEDALVKIAAYYDHLTK